MTMRALSDIETLWHLLASQPSGSDHAERMQSFYSRQSAGYDSFRERLLQGRKELMESIPIRPGGTLLDLGGGTGRNIEWLGDRLNDLSSVTVVDLCSDLLRIAQRRVVTRKWHNVHVVRDDATALQADAGSIDAITFSYSLTMIPNWVDAIEHAYELLAPGGSIGVADFYVSPKWPKPGRVQHSSITRFFWPTWFSHSNVFLNPGHLQLLERRFITVRLRECRARVPYLCGLKVPYYVFIGTKPK